MKGAMALQQMLRLCFFGSGMGMSLLRPFDFVEEGAKLEAARRVGPPRPGPGFVCSPEVTG